MLLGCRCVSGNCIRWGRGSASVAKGRLTTKEKKIYIVRRYNRSFLALPLGMVVCKFGSLNSVSKSCCRDVCCSICSTIIISGLILFRASSALQVRWLLQDASLRPCVVC